MLWLLLAAMLAAAATFVGWPMYRGGQRLSRGSVIILLLALVGAPLLYLQLGQPEARSPGAAASETDRSIQDMVASLAAKMQTSPDDLAGWKMLGRSYFELKRFPDAIAAFERAVELESGADAQTLTDLGEAMLMNDQSSITGRAGELFESALALSPANPKALFYGGLAAINRGDPQAAADRWEALLATSPPEHVQAILRQRIAELRGAPMPAVAAAPAGGVAGEGSESSLTAEIELAPAAAAAVKPDATVFIIVRDPAQPSPPIAAVRRRVSELPATVTLSDSDAMIPGRVPSAFAELEVVARVSASGGPIARSGDWFGQQKVLRGAAGPLQIRIDQQVP